MHPQPSEHGPQLVADTYDLVLAEVEIVPEQQGLPEDHPPILYAVLPGGLVGLTANPDKRLLESMAPGLGYVVFRGAGKIDKNGLPERFERADRFEVEVDLPTPARVHKRKRSRK